MPKVNSRPLELEEIGVLPEKEEPLSFEKIFGNTHPVEFEIGCGKGKFLAGRAASFPDTNFIGIDRVAKWMQRAQKKKEKQEITNLLFLKANAYEIIERIPFESVSIFHVYFPDPWPKRRHQKRRLVNAEFLKWLSDRLKKGGAIEIATDHEDYYPFIRKEALEWGLGWASWRESRGARLFHEDLKTHYELRFEQAGKKNFYLELIK
jgi:tRNA (guanine-N7-)-methyltransferase